MSIRGFVRTSSRDMRAFCLVEQKKKRAALFYILLQNVLNGDTL